VHSHSRRNKFMIPCQRRKRRSHYAAATALWQMNDKSGEGIFAEIVQGDRKISVN
jgi:hypothetical protein